MTRLLIIPVLFVFLLQEVYAFQQQDHIMTVNGSIPVSAMGKTLIHEHILTNFQGTGSANQVLHNQQQAFEMVFPNLLQLKSLGYATLVECTPSHIGKNAALLKRLSEESGINIITNTGYYAAVDKKYLPDEAYSKTAEQLADVWEAEYTQGIGNTGIRPGFIKLGVGSGPLDEVERKIVKAGFLLSSRSGLTVYVHTGGDQSILSQAGLAEQMKFNFGKLVWVHAQNGTDSTRIAMAKKGMWVSLDGVNVKHLDDYIAMISVMRDAGVLHRLLLSHDDGWSVEKDGDELVLTLFNNGNPTPYNSIERKLVPKLQEIGFSPQEIELLLVENPGRALIINR